MPRAKPGAAVRKPDGAVKPSTKGGPGPKEHNAAQRSTQFQKGNPGRPLGSRHKISESFLKAVLIDFDRHGAEAIAGARAESPLGYCRMVASLLPKHVQVTDGKAEKMSDAELVRVIQEGVSEVADQEDDGNRALTYEPNVSDTGRA